MAVNWTEDQKEVINTRKKNILVSAAAGSGKTAVLVERIVSMVTEGENPVDIDKILVVTFTNAAASEMRERVLKSIEELSEKNPENEHLQRQQSYIHNAEIMTIDSFCMKVVKEHFDEINLDPGFRIGEEGELKLLMTDVIDDMLEDFYENGSDDFFTFVDEFSNSKSDKNIAEDILMLYRYTSSRPEPEKWLESCKSVYDITSADELKESDWFKYILEYADDILKQCLEEIKRAEYLCSLEGGPKGYETSIKLDRKFAEELFNAEFNERVDKINSHNFGRIGNISKKEAEKLNPDYVSSVKAIRDNFKETVKMLANDVYFQYIEDMVSDIKGASASAKALVDLTIEFIKRYNREKAEKNIVDFSDIEHYAYSILTAKNEKGEVVPSGVAKELSEKYVEIMIDEYQDSNYLQEYILNSVAKGQGYENVFMVGDVKQSIYGFRHASPELFIQKYHTYSTDNKAEYWKKNLSKNFRSRKEIIESVNYIFGKIMNADLGGIEYDEDSKLYVGAEYPKVPDGQDQNTELIYVEDNSRGKDKFQTEAMVIACRIKELMNPDDRFRIFDRKTNEYKDIKYSDIVILARDVKSISDIYTELFTEEGIPFYTESRAGYLDSIEIKTILNLLTIINNPVDDIPLASVLKSPIYNFTSTDFAKIRSANEGNSFYDSVVMYAESGEDAELKGKIVNFLNKLAEYRKMASYTAIYDLISFLYEDTDYYNYAAAMPGGSVRCRNLDILYNKAAAYDDSSYKGLFKFVKYIENLKKIDIDYGEASVLGENDDIVRLMSIHKSKGLQFPVVFVCGLGKAFMTRDLYSPILLSPEFGIGIDNIDSKMRMKSPTIIKNTIKYAVRQSKYAEEMRVLYVALTRAEEKLILTATLGKVEEKINRWKSEAYDEKIIPLRILSSSSFIDWISAAIGGRSREKASVEVKLAYSDNENIEDFDGENLPEQYKIFEKINQDECYDADIAKEIRARVTFKYPYMADTLMQSKTSVSKLKIRAMEYDAEMDGVSLDPAEEAYAVPEFIEEKKVLEGADRGTAYHRVFELFDFDVPVTENGMQEMLKRFFNMGRIDKATFEAVKVGDLITFANSNLGIRMSRAYKNGKLFREQPYVMGISAADIDENCSDDEVVLVQGVIDVCFEENGEMVIADYKTDNVNTMQQLVDKYKVQLEYYERAITQVAGMKVKEKIIYSVKLGEEVKL